MKPENILITESGHIKVTDFGGCRPVTTESRSIINNVSKNVLRRLRDGDWREVTPSNDFGELDEVSNEGYDENNGDGVDMRIEGTTAYLPPEVVLGGVPTAAADSWALGCVLFQCLSGRPPILEDDDHSTKQKIVSFDIQVSSGDAELFMGSDGTDAFCKESKSLVKNLLHPIATERPTMIGCSQHMFFNGMDVFSLYKKTPYPLNVGSSSPVVDAKWSRRQFSSIWAPQPQKYTIGIEDNRMKNKDGVFEWQAVPIEEGDEAPALFSKDCGNPMLGKINEK